MLLFQIHSQILKTAQQILVFATPHLQLSRTALRMSTSTQIA